MQWFSSNAVPNTYNLGCGISGLGTTQSHTIRLINQPVPGWSLTVISMSLSTTPSTTASGSTPIFSYVPNSSYRQTSVIMQILRRSFYLPYDMPEALVSTAQPTNTPITSCGNGASPANQRISPAVTGAVEGVLGILAFASWIVTAWFWRKREQKRKSPGVAAPAMAQVPAQGPALPEGGSRSSFTQQ